MELGTSISTEHNDHEPDELVHVHGLVPVDVGLTQEPLHDGPVALVEPRPILQPGQNWSNRFEPIQLSHSIGKMSQTFWSMGGLGQSDKLFAQHFNL